VGLNTTLAEQLALVVRLAPQVLLLIAKSPALAPPIATLLIVIEPLVPFVRVAICAALVDPTAMFLNPRDVGDTVTLPPDVVPPVPDKAAVWGLLLAESDTVKIAARDPLTVGLNAMETVQLAEAAKLEPQVLLEMLKSAGLAPASEIPLMVIDDPVPFFSVAACDELVDPTFTDPKERLVGLILTAPPEPVPVPDKATVWGVFVAESLKFKVAVRVPLVVGAKTTFAVQLAPAARLDPHVLL
jgi:hypothetical protein